MKLILEVTGCCGRYRARLLIRPDSTSIITIETFADRPEQARDAAYDWARQMLLDGLDLTTVTVKTWPRS